MMIHEQTLIPMLLLLYCYAEGVLEFLSSPLLCEVHEVYLLNFSASWRTKL